jgi:DNA-binding beta-propeller fold protein YncE
LAYATYPAAPLNPRDYGPLLGALVRLSNEIQYVTADQKPSLSPVQLPSAPSQTLVAGTLNAYSTSGAPFSVAVTGQPTNGIVTIDSSSGSYIYTPNAGLAAAGGTDTFTITATDTGFHPLAALLGQPAHATTVTVPVTVAVASPAGTTGTTAYYVTNTSYKTMQVAYYDNNGAQLSPAAGTTLATGESTEFQISDGNSVTVHFNPANVSHQGVIQAYGANNPYGVAVSPDGETIYAVETGGRSVLTFRDIESGLVTASVELSPTNQDASALAATPDGTRVYALDVSGKVSVVSTASRTVTGTVSLGNVAGAYQIALSPNGKNAYITTWTGSQAYVSVLDTDPSSANYNSVVAEVNLGGGGAVGVAVNPSGTRAYVTTTTGYVRVIDTGTNTLSDSIPLSGATGVAVSPDGNTAYVAFGGGLAVIDTATNTIKTTVGGLSTALVVAVKPDGKHVYVGSSHQNGDTGGTFYYPSSNSYLYDINAVTYEVASPITMASKPGGDFSFPSTPTSLAIAPDGKSIWAGIPNSGLVAQVAVVTDGTISDDGVSEYTVFMSGGSGSCLAKGKDVCTVAGTSTYLLDPPGTVWKVPQDQAQQQSDVLQNLVYDDTSNAKFVTKSKATIGYTNPLIPGNYSPTSNPASSSSTTVSRFDVTLTTTQADSTTYSVSVKAGADVKLGLLTAKAEGTYTDTWGTTVSKTETYTQSWTQTIFPGYTSYIYMESATQRFYGDWYVDYGNTTYYMPNVWYDTPFKSTGQYASQYVVAGDCVTGSAQCQQLANGDTSSLIFSTPTAAPTYVVAESNNSSSYTAYSSSVYTS